MAIALYFQEFTKNETSYEYVPLIKEFAHGCVINVGTRSAQIMSDIWDTEYYAEYWDEKSESVKSIGLYCANESQAWERASWAEVDATEEVWQKVEKFYYDCEYRKLESDALSEAKQIVKESVVKVTGGRQHKGVQGKVAVIIQRAYGMGYRSSIENKLGIATSDVKIQKQVGRKVYENYKDVVWVWARNCELVTVPEIDVDHIKESATLRARRRVDSIKKSGLKQTYNRKVA